MAVVAVCTHCYYYIELFVQAIWENQFYYMFGFLFLVFCVLIISCAEISIVMTYMQLCAEVQSSAGVCLNVGALWSLRSLNAMCSACVGARELGRDETSVVMP